MKKDKTVLYYCTSVYQVLILTMMVELRYSQYKNIVVLESNSNIVSKLDLEHAKPYIDETIILPPKIKRSQVESMFSCLFENNDVILFGFFTWGGRGGDIYNVIPDKVKIVLLDEGVSTCEYKKFMSYVVREIDFSRIKEIWMLDTNISQNDKTIPEYRIPLEEICRDKWRFKKYLALVNPLFKYQWEPMECDVLFFDRYMVQTGRVPINYERFVLESLIKLIGNKKFSVKLHPFEKEALAKWRYRNLPVRFCEASDVPWELIVLNYMCEVIDTGNQAGFPQVLIAANTTTLFTTQNLLNLIGIEIPIIYINRVIHKYLKEIEIVAEKTLEGYQSVYKNRKIYLPFTWEELYRDLKLCIPDLASDITTLEEVHSNEFALLSNEYQKTLRTCGNLLQQVYIEVNYRDKNSGEEKEEIYYSFIIGGDRQYKITFSDFIVKNALQINLRLFPVGTPLVCRNFTLDRVSYSQNGEELEIDYNIDFTLSNKIPYISFVIDAAGCEISNLEVVYTANREYQLLFETEQLMRFRNYYNILVKWIVLLQKNRDCFCDFCEKWKCKKVGVYGNGVIGKLLKTQLSSCGLETVMIDRVENEEVISASQALEDLQEWDLIIVTPLFDYYNIEKMFGISEKIIGLDDLLGEMEEEEM